MQQGKKISAWGAGWRRKRAVAPSSREGRRRLQVLRHADGTFPGRNDEQRAGLAIHVGANLPGSLRPPQQRSQLALPAFEIALRWARKSSSRALISCIRLFSGQPRLIADTSAEWLRSNRSSKAATDGCGPSSSGRTTQSSSSGAMRSSMTASPSAFLLGKWW